MVTTFQNPLFIDIETVSSVAKFELLPPAMQSLWLRKAERFATTLEAQKAAFFERGGIFAEFGKIVVIALGYVATHADKAPSLHVMGLADDDEKALLQRFKTLLMRFPAHTQLCGHNGKEFDFPYLARRMTVCGVPLPPVLDTAGKKPWEVNHVDTMELWKFGDRKNYTSLDLLAHLLDIPSSKDDMTGAEVNAYYYERKDLPSIKRYCMKDVVTTAQLYRKLKFLPLIAPDAININPSPSLTHVA